MRAHTAPVPTGPSGPAAPAALTTHGLTFSIGGAVLVSDVDLSVAEGELVGVIGPNGAGKTTLLNLLSGVLAPTAGTVHLRGADVTATSVPGRARAGLGRTFQTSSVFPGLPVGENVRLAAQARLGGSLQIWRRVTAGGRAMEIAQESLATVGLGGRSDALAASLSHGDKRKLELAILLATDSAVLLLDEPMAGVSMEDVEGLTEVIRTVNTDQGRTVVMVEHHIDVVLGLADRVAVMHHGSLLRCDTPDLVMADPTVQEAYLGQAL